MKCKVEGRGSTESPYVYSVYPSAAGADKAGGWAGLGSRKKWCVGVIAFARGNMIHLCSALDNSQTCFMGRGV